MGYQLCTKTKTCGERSQKKIHYLIVYTLTEAASEFLLLIFLLSSSFLSDDHLPRNPPNRLNMLKLNILIVPRSNQIRSLHS